MLPILKQWESRIDINKTLVENDCKRAKVMCEAGSTMSPELLPNTQTVLKIYNTLPVGTATVERVLCCMNRIHTYARSSLLSSLAGDLIRLL